MSELSELLTSDDVRAIVHMLGELAAMDASLPEKRRRLLEDVAKLIDADVWAWALGKFDDSGLPVLLWLIEGGWASPEQREIVMSTNFDPDAAEVAAKAHAVKDESPTTNSRTQIIPNEEWYASHFYRKFRLAANLDDFIFMLYPLQRGMNSVMSYHRNCGKPPFGDREWCIVHLIATEVDWLHRAGTDVPAPSNLFQLSPRQREVLLMLLAGDSRKQITYKLHLSDHTIAFYMKALHKHFHVNSRGELLAKFISGASEK